MIMMGAFGRFMELSVPCADVLRSLDFYRNLGFTELATGDIRIWHYAVVTDGAIAIGLHGGGIGEPALSFVRPNLARQVSTLQAAGQEFEFSRLGVEQFHEAALRSPDGQLIWMIEARTFSPGGTDDPAPLPGRCAEMQLGCNEVAVTQCFLEAAGFLLLDEQSNDLVRLQIPGLTLALRAGRPSAPILRFRPRHTARLCAQLEGMGINARRTAEGHVITAPEGTRLLLG